jgi:hypothetical protein
MDAGVLAAWVGGVGLPIAFTVFGFILRTYKERIDDAKSEAVKARTELQEYKLVVAEKYASITYLKDVEGRILGAITDMTRRFDSFVEDYHSSRQGR